MKPGTRRLILKYSIEGVGMMCGPSRLSCLVLLFVVASVLKGWSQCAGLPPVASLGSNKLPVGLCSPVQANVTYNVSFTSPVTSGVPELVYDWGDGSTPEIIPLTAGATNYTASRMHNFPVESDCEYYVVMMFRINGVNCTATRQIQKISSWRTDKYNGADVKLVSPVTKTSEHLVCEGADIDVVFSDASNFACDARFVQQPPGAIESPNTEIRWQQIVYNTTTADKKIPNVMVDGTPVTDANGNAILTEYQDPRGVYSMPAPVTVNDPRRRSSLRITAPGGFGSNHPKAGQIFKITLRYWNFCNPYDDPNIPGPPADKINGDHPPVEKPATIKIQAAPAPPTASAGTACFSTTPSNFTVSGTPTDAIIRWYKHNPETGQPGDLITSGVTKTFPITSHPDWHNNKTPGHYKVWVSYEPKVAGALLCESPKILATRTIRENISVPDPIENIPGEICNATTITVKLPAPATEPVGGPTVYTWNGSDGIALISTTATSATFKINLQAFGTAMYAERTLTVGRKYANTPDCGATRTFPIRVYRPASGGSLNALQDVCETEAAGTLTLSGYTGTIQRWEVKKDNRDYQLYEGPSSATSISPGTLAPGTYMFRAVVGNGLCAQAYSNVEEIRVFQKSAAGVFAGNDQFICTSLSSIALGASDPAPGTGTWSYVSSVPANLPAPTFSTGKNDRNTMISIDAVNAGAYTLRWTVSNGACVTSDDVVIDFGTDPTVPDAGKDKNVCGPVTALEGNVPSKGLGTWSVVSGPQRCEGKDCPITIASPSSPTSAIELTDIERYGTYVFRWSISSGGNNCFMKYDDVSITFDRSASVKIQTPDTVCLDPENLAPINLGAVVSNGQASWMKVSGKGTLTNIAGSTDVANATYMPAYEDYVSSSVTLKLVATTNGVTSCKPIESILKLPLDRKPVARAEALLPAFCSDTVAVRAALPEYGAKGVWSTKEAGVTFDDAQAPSTIVRNLPKGARTIAVEWTVTSASGTCVSQPSTVLLNRVSPPVANNINASACAVPAWGSPDATTIILTEHENAISPLPPSGRKVTWYRGTSASEGMIITDPTAAQTHVENGQVYIGRIRDVATNCQSDARVTVRVNPLPNVNDALVRLCEDAPGSGVAGNVDLSHKQFTSQVTNESNATVTWHKTQEDAASGISAVATTVTIKSRDRYYARVVNGASQCFAIARLEFMVNTKPTVTAISGRASVCLADAGESGNIPVEIYQVTPVSGAKYYWEIPDGPSQFRVFSGGKETDFFVMLQFPNVYHGKLRLRVELNGCSSTVLEKDIAVTGVVPAPQIEGGDAVCAHDNNVVYKIAGNTPSSPSYSWDIRKATDNTEGGAYIAAGQSTASVSLNFLDEDVYLSVRETNSGCAPGAVTTKLIRVNKRPRVQVTAGQDITALPGQGGTIRTAVSDGTPPYTEYQLLPNGMKNDHGVFTNLAKGTYSVRVVDASGCASTSPAATLTLPKDQPGAPVVAAFLATPEAACTPVVIDVVNKTMGADTFLWKLYNDTSLITTSNLRVPAFKISNPGVYTLKLFAGAAETGRGDSAIVEGIRVFDTPHADFTVRTPTYAPSTPLQLFNYTTAGNFYQWDFGDGTTSYDFEPRHEYEKAGNYTITLIAGYDLGEKNDGSAQGLVCYDSTKRDVVVLDRSTSEIPNAFTPSRSGPNDGAQTHGGYNDVFLPSVKNCTRFELQIFDRWGNLVFESRDANIGWDGYNREGKLLPAGVYVYKLSADQSDGGHTNRVGDVTLIR